MPITTTGIDTGNEKAGMALAWRTIVMSRHCFKFQGANV